MSRRQRKQKKQKKQQKLPIIMSEVDEAAYLRRMLGLHPGLVYVRNPSLGKGVRQWVVADREACDSAAALVWRGVTVISAGPSRVMVAGQGKRQLPAPPDSRPASVPGSAVVEVWEDKRLLRSTPCPTLPALAEEIRKAYDAIGADSAE